MHQRLLNTKFCPPARPPTMIERVRLHDLLNAGLRGAATLVSAPAGYGKSVLISGWLSGPHAPNLPVAWLALEEADDEPGRFLRYLVAALRQHDATFCNDLFAALQAQQLPPDAVLLTTLINALLELPSPRILVLDDVQHLQDQRILSILAALLSQHPINLHLILITREDPPLPLARLRAHGLLGEVRAADLRFSLAESRAFLQTTLGLDLGDAEVVRLNERTEGWPVGLQLAGLSLQGHADPRAFVESLSGTHRFILAYLTEEALKTQPAEVQEFLLLTSILQQLSGDLCAVLTGRHDSAALLERLVRANLFIIPLDDGGHWYRYHHLFGELLLHQLRRTYPERITGLHQRASDWYAAHDLPASAIEHSLAATDYPQVVGLLEAHHWRLINQGYARSIERWVQRLPDEWRTSSPQTSLGFAWVALLRGQFHQIEPYLAAAQASLSHATVAQPSLQATMLTLQANLAQMRGQTGEALALAEEARRIAPVGDLRLSALIALALGATQRQAGDFASAIVQLQRAIQTGQQIGDHVTAMLAVAHLALLTLQSGQLRFFVRIAEDAVAQTEAQKTAPFMVGAVHIALAQVYYEWGRVAAARETLQRGMHLATLSGHSASLAYGKIHLARFQQGAGDLEAAEQSLGEAEAFLAQGLPEWVRNDWLVGKVALLVAQQRLDAAAACLRSSGIPADAPVSQQSERVHLAWLRWMVASQHPDGLGLAERICAAAEQAQRYGSLIHALILGAQAGGGTAWLERAQQLGASEGYQRSFVDDRLVLHVPQPPPLVEPLSEREIEVLRLLAAGYSYTQIAAQLVLSVNTVRYHIKGLYGKLGVNKQVQAIERARALGYV
ncbi:TPR repeat-containing transcriptional regulator LuxR [Oscillochloris trichoides DG-6]|uniref:TPR repeat-containing transcriptional regulator LuxR n=1 Tax=Oscillochloris trichoides DG-6 TaxID=765420 RepID=E1IGQ5_9CHLR|nr:LuxR C-terminal-related transcriptional regulator [Oscillochloris trichoides]EFO79642.1 TPR repeat-containing transcriptional regulator LuxR [Oscillochloris trichoides DG-6]